MPFFNLSQQLMSGKAVMMQKRADSSAVPTDSESIVAQAKNLLSSCSYIAVRGVTCELKEGILVLKGCVPSYFLKQVAQTRVGRNPLPRVDNQIEVIVPCTVESHV